MTPGIRWTIGDVAPRGFTALRLSVWGAFGVFGPEARYAVVVNGVRPEEAAARAGPLPPGVAFVAAHGLAPLLRARLDAGMAEGVAWKFAPPRVFPDRPELSLDNDCILWAMPAAIRRWLEGPPSAVLAEDVRPAFGRFEAECGTAPRNTGIRGLPPGFDVSAALGAALARSPGGLTSELDEQGLQVAALQAALPVHVVRVDEVTICSPFPPHLQELGTCGAHFVGLNARRLGWSTGGRPAEDCTCEHFDALRADVEARVGAPDAGRLATRPPDANSACGSPGGVRRADFAVAVAAALALDRAPPHPEEHRMRTILATLAAAALVLAPAARAQSAWDVAKKAAGKSTTGKVEKEVNKRLLEEGRKNQCSFKSGTAELVKGCDKKAQRLAKALIDAKKKLNTAGLQNFKFVVSGHTDSTGSAEKNKQLSAERAAVMVKQLVAQGVPAGDIESVGMGSEQPLVKPDDTEAKRAKNRRYEVQVKL